MASFLIGRSPREKILAAALGAFILLWLITTQIWGPLQEHRRDIAARIPRIERALAHLQATPEPQDAPEADLRATPVLITDAADSFGLKISRLQPQGTQVQMTLEDAPFDTVLLWIEALQRVDALRLVDLTLTRRPAVGVVGTTLTLER